MHEIAKCEDETQLHAHATDCGRGRKNNELDKGEGHLRVEGARVMSGVDGPNMSGQRRRLTVTRMEVHGPIMGKGINKIRVCWETHLLMCTVGGWESWRSRCILRRLDSE